MPVIPRAERRRRNLLVVELAVPSVILMLMAGLVFINTRRISEASFWVSHTWQVKAVLHELSAATERALTAERNFILTKQPEYLERHASARASVDEVLKRIAGLTDDNPLQKRDLQLLTNAVRDRRLLGDEIINLARDGDAQAQIQSAISREEASGERLRAVIAVMDHEEDRLLAVRQQRESRQATRSIVVLGALLLLNFVTIALVVRLLRRVQRLKRLVTICAWSRLLRHGDEWVSIEEFLEREYGVSVTHGMSEEELAKFQRQVDEIDKEEGKRKNLEGSKAKGE